MRPKMFRGRFLFHTFHCVNTPKKSAPAASFQSICSHNFKMSMLLYRNTKCPWSEKDRDKSNHEEFGGSEIQRWTSFNFSKILKSKGGFRREGGLTVLSPDQTCFFGDPLWGSPMGSPTESPMKLFWGHQWGEGGSPIILNIQNGSKSRVMDRCLEL